MLHHALKVALVGCAVGAFAGSQHGGRLAGLDIPDSLMAQRVVPAVRGRAVCRAFDSTPGYGTCDFGQGLRISFSADTIRSVTKTVTLSGIDANEPLLDYWNQNLRDGWEAKMGRPADSLSQPLMMFDMLTAVWSMPDSLRHSVALTRLKGETTLMHEVVDCRAGEAGGWCRLTPKQKP